MEENSMIVIVNILIDYFVQKIEFQNLTMIKTAPAVARQQMMTSSERKFHLEFILIVE